MDLAGELHGEAYENLHVHHVYDQIASHFSSTRYKVCIMAIILFVEWLLYRQHIRRIWLA